MKSMLITGASRGIGRATALALASPGANLVLAARSAEPLEATAAEVRTAGASAVVIPCDVTIEPQVRQLVARAAEATGHIDLVVHSVGSALVAPLEQIELTAWEEQLRTHMTSLFLMCKYATAHMGSGGLFINIASVAARQAFPWWAAYSAAKHGTLGFMNAVREELRPRGIRVTSVFPGPTNTELWHQVPGNWNRDNMLSPEEVAAAVAALASYPPHVAVEELAVSHVVGRL